MIVYLKEYDRNIEIEIEFDVPFQYEVFKGTTPVAIPKVAFAYSRYKIGDYKGQRRLEKNCLGLDNKQIQILSEKPKSGTPHKFRPLTTIPQELQESIPVIYIGIDRTLKNQLPNARNSLLGTLLSDINKNFQKEENTISIKNREGKIVDIARNKRFSQCIEEAIKTLRTDEFIELEKRIKKNALNQLGFDSEKDADKIDIFFNPLSSIEFYKSLDIWVKEHDYSINATELGSGFQNAIVISILKAFEV